MLGHKSNNIVRVNSIGDIMYIRVITTTLVILLLGFFIQPGGIFAQGKLVEPKWMGVPVDNCLYWARECGWPAAHEFCKRQGFKNGAKSFNLSGPLRETVIITSGQKCTPDRSPTGKCIGFDRIECKDFARKGELVEPKWMSVPVDNCLYWARECGWPAAHEFCKRQGFKNGAKNFNLSGPLRETVIITSGQKCTPDRSPTGKCIGFDRIECKD
jgi:predicted lipid carrier protein YhbT